MAGGGSNGNSPRTPGGTLVVSPMQPTFCLPLFGVGGRRALHRRARTMQTVPSARKEQEAREQQEQQEQGDGPRKMAAQWPWLAAGGGAGGAGGVKGRRQTLDYVRPRRGQQEQQQKQEAETTTTVVAVAAAAVATSTSSTTTTTVVSAAGATTTTTSTVTSSTVTETAAVAVAAAAVSTTTHVADSSKSVVTSAPAPPPGSGLIPSESSTTLPLAPTKAASITVPQPQQQTAPAPRPPQRRGPFRSQSMGALPNAATATKPPTHNKGQPVDPHDRFYPPGLRKRDSIGDSSTGGSFIDELAPSLGALRNRFSASQRRRSFAGSTAHSRRQSLEDITVREDFEFRAGADAPALPPRLLPMISHGMARLAINMKDAVMTPATWEVVYSVLKPEDAAKVKRYRFEKDRRLALGSQLLQRAVIAWTFGVPYQDILIARTEKGKPFFHVPPHVETPFPNWNYNVSHHGDFVGIASEPVCLVGLDIMNARERPRRNSANEFFRSFHRQLSGAEWGAIYQAPNDDGKLERFYKQWALKEAYIKAIGSGLTFSPRRIEITGLDHSERPNSEAPYDPSVLRIDGAERPNWRFKFAALDNGHVACVSRGPPSDAIEDYRQVLRVQHLPQSPLRFGLESVQPNFDLISLRELIPQDKLAAFDESLVDTPVLAPQMSIGGSVGVGVEAATPKA